MTTKQEQKTEGRKHPGGRPRKYQSIEQLQAAIDSYFKTTVKMTVTGLAYHLGFTSRADLINNEGYSEEFYYALKRAKLRIEMYYEEHLVGSKAAGPIFALKNFNWTDKHDYTSGGEAIEPMQIVDFSDLLEKLKAKQNQNGVDTGVG